MAAALLAPVASFAERKAQEIAADPWTWIGKLCLKLGTGFTLTGFGLGTGAYFLKASATAAANNEARVIGNIGNIFSNIKAPTFHPAASGTAPLTPNLAGVQNFFADAGKDIVGAASDVAQIGAAMGTLAEDVADGFIDVAKAFLAFVMHFPDILWNGFVLGVGGAMADLLSWLFPWLIIIGVALILVGTAILAASRIWNATAKPAFDRASGQWLARREAKVERFFDRIFHNPSPPSIEAGPAAEAQRTQSEGAEERNPPDVAPTEPATPAATEIPPEPAPEPVPAPIPAETSTPTPPPSVEVHVDLPPGVATRAELEQHLGERPNRAPTMEEMAKMLVEAEAERQKTLPKKEPPVSGFEESQKAAKAFADAEGNPAAD